MAPGFDPATIKPKSQRNAKLFGAGRLNMMILDAMRRAKRPMQTTKITAAVANAMGFEPEAEAGLRSRVRSNLLYLAKVRGVGGEGRGEGGNGVATKIIPAYAVRHFFGVLKWQTKL